MGASATRQPPGRSISVRHLPPGTSKWNKIEHQFFSHIAMNWRGKPLVSLAAIVSLIGSTKTEKGVRGRAESDPGEYATGGTDHRCYKP